MERTGAADGRRRVTTTVQTRRSSARVGIATVFIVVTPLVVAVARAIQGGWMPVGDNALIAIRTDDVFSRHPPLLGTGSSISNVLGDDVNNLGPLLFDVLAAPAKLFGSRSGLTLGVALVNALSVIGIAVFAHRRGGTPFTVAAMAVTSALMWGMGSELLVDPWQPHSLMLPFLCFLVMIWSLAAGDLAALPWAAGVGSLVLQTHLSYGFLVAALSVWGTAALAAALLHRRRHDPEGWPALWKRVRRVVTITAVVVVACWSQPLLEQLTADGPGNLTLLLRNVDASEGTLGYGRGTRLTAGVVALPPWSLQAGSGVRTPPTAAVAAVAWAGLASLLAACAWFAGRRRIDTGVFAIATASVALLAGLLTAARTPVTAPLIGPFAVAPHHVRWLWPVASFVLLAIASTAIAIIGPRRAAVLAVGFACVAAVLSATNVVERNRGASSRQGAMSVARDLVRQMGTLEGAGPLLVDAPVAYDPYGPAVMRELQRRGVAFVAVENVAQIGPTRRFTGTNARARLTVAVGDDARTVPAGDRRIAAHNGLSTKEHVALIALQNEVARFVDRGGLRLTERGRHAMAVIAASNRTPEAGRTDRAADALALYRADVLLLDREWRARFARYDDLQARWDRESVALFLGPIDT
jgi:hypothetical protein